MAAAARLRLVLESIAENHAEYRDWNSTTTQSDRGECLHMLLDFLRIKAEHDRIAWTLRPVNMAHGVLARRGVGAALLKACETAAAAAGFARTELMATLPGVPFYTAYGYQAVSPISLDCGGVGPRARHGG